MLFSLDTSDELPTSVSEAAVEAAIDFVVVCCQHSVYISGRGKFSEDLELIKAGNTYSQERVSHTIVCVTR